MEQYVPEIESEIGIETYATRTPGIGGAIKQSLEDFVVQEVLVDGSEATVELAKTKPPLGATLEKQPFLLCVMVKRNWDTLIAIKNVARELGIDQARIQIAGIKDAKAVTAQHITIKAVDAEATGRVKVKDVNLRPLGYFHEPLSPYYLLGNNFKINITKISVPKDMVKERIHATMQQLTELGGIPNFYGHQRFGTTRPITHTVGKALVQGKLEKAAMTFLAKPSPHEHPNSMDARQQLQANKDFKQALRDFPVQLRFERLMLAYLAENPVDFVGAFRRLPLRLRLLFVQAYQSFLFNRFLSQRIRSGIPLDIAQAGDYVVNVEKSCLPMSKTGKIVYETKLKETNELIKARKMRVALPVLGFAQRLSQGEAGEMQHKVLNEEGIDLRGFRIVELPEMSGKGELRAVVSPVRDFGLQVQGDLDDSASYALLEFGLLRSSYATILLREIMKQKDPIAAGF